MNIREHIEAGHYPTDDKGRARVEFRGGGWATICATDGPGEFCLVGFGTYAADSWKADGTGHPPYAGECLLPPPPRKVKVTRWGSAESCVLYDTPAEAHEAALRHPTLGPVVEWTTEYEEQP